VNEEIAGFRRLVQANASFASLLGLDSWWTAYASDHRRAEDEPLSVFEVAVAFSHELRAAVLAADEIVKLIAGDQFESVPSELARLLASTDDGQTVLNALAENGGRVRDLAAAGRDEMREYSPAEERQLVADARGIITGQPTRGLLGDRFLCGLAKVSIAAGLASVWIPPHAHALPIVALGSKVYQAARCGRL